MAEQQTLFGLTDFELFVRDELIGPETGQDYVLVDFEIMQRNDARLKDKT